MIIVRPACAHRAIASIDQALVVLAAFASAQHEQDTPQAVVTPLTIVSLRGLLQHAREQVKDAISTGADIEAVQ